ncbi:conserved membrane protein of unknown function [Pseudodesulfovibrio profundus]|uniref:Membrane protein YdfK n=1 Tax=Pseudodesulfovibrio profundus TaxID=57320 RepID=A0A2C8F921_9BACT|nr:DUF554 domain-containing protein [Pseudodesulfovibrio profundus]MBC16612.1 hypothetical protein [Desulfovibrio sp.]SOB58364.1 conserved membrane protein of unknown function [Pseudodesulfovibrio profundus]|tara:strand:- start:732 stop:1415 length:684 start_codon:yes stop_codon:yes gene_type:complete
MLPVGSIVNALAIIGGSIIGCWLQSRFPDRIRSIVFQGLGLCVLLIGIQMALKVENILIVIFAILLGAITGELCRLDTLFERMGNRLKGLLKSKNPKFTEGLITASLIYCIGAMAIVGALEEGINGNPEVLLTKSILDGFASIALAASYGSGVFFSFIPVLLYQGIMTIGASYFQQYFSDMMIAQITACGGLLIIGIGINLLELTEIKLANLLPSLGFVVILTALFA